MTDYKAPYEEIIHALSCHADMSNWTNVPAFAEASEDLVSAILDEAGRLARDVIAPTNAIGDREGAQLEGTTVVAPPSSKAIFDAYLEGGWASLPWPEQHGGQGLPMSLALAVQEIFNSANMAYFLNPMLTMGTIEAILAHGTEEQIEKFVPHLISGAWSGAMNLTESQAGSDVGALRTKAEPVGDGTYKIKGTKIFITWGDHEFAENIIHLVLARIPGAPAGTKGISMFIVPKFLVNDDGMLGERNDVYCTGLEEKLGIHGSPTCVMSFGESDNCIGYLCGDEGKGMRNMFTMMNNARVNVGLQGVSVAERAYQAAVSYASDRVQSLPVDRSSSSAVAIIKHPDVRRMVLEMRALTEAARALVYRNVWAIDRSHSAECDAERSAARGEADLLTPLSKAWGTMVGCEVADLAVQVCGGMGYIEETGVAQYLRDVRITPIYEGTNGIQAMDLIGRKLHMDAGVHWRALLNEMDSGTNCDALKLAIAKTREAAEHIVETSTDDINSAAGVAEPFLKLFATTAGGYFLAEQALRAEQLLSAGGRNAEFLEMKVATSAFFTDHILPRTQGYHSRILTGAKGLYSFPSEGLKR